MQPLFGSPLVRWDGAHLVFRLELVERRLAELLRPVAERVRDIRLEGEGDVVRVHATVVWKGRGARVAVDLGEVRLRHRRLGFRVGRVRVMGGVPLPRAAVLAVCRALRSPLLQVVGGPDILVVDLRAWLPPELCLRLVTLQCTERYLHLWLGPGELRDLPGPGLAALPGEAAGHQVPRLDSSGGLR